MGAIAPSSGRLAAQMVDAANLTENEKVLEIGTGTGSITTEIIKKLSGSGDFLSVEKNQGMAKKAELAFANQAEINNADIKDVDRKRVFDMDCVFSSLPMTIWGHASQVEVINIIHDVMSQKGRLIFYTYLTANTFGGKQRLLSNIESAFKLVNQHSIVWKNLPPAALYVCEK